VATSTKGTWLEGKKSEGKRGNSRKHKKEPTNKGESAGKTGMKLKTQKKGQVGGVHLWEGWMKNARETVFTESKSGARRAK